MTTLALIAASGVAAQDRSAYDRRYVTRSLELFRSLDIDSDGAVSAIEARRDVHFVRRFGALDIDRDGRVTRSELHRYLALAHGMSADEQRADAAPAAVIAERTRTNGSVRAAN
jgi:Ca2+-binding EF-hand superfamily protein